MTAALQLLQSTRLSAMVQALEDIRLLPQQLKFSQRVLDSDSWDGEILARDIARVHIADIIADNSQAGVYSTGKLTTETFNIPNLKIGVAFQQDQLNQLSALGQMGGLPTADDPGTLWPGSGLGMVESIVRDRAARIELGVQHRKEALIIAMELDSLTYDRMGIKISSSWGMPADLKSILLNTATWDNASTAKGIYDILYRKLYAQTRYGETYNRVTMSTTAFQYLTAQADYQARARSVLVRYGATVAPLPIEDLTQQTTIFESLTGCMLELYDARYWQQAEDGSYSATPFFPLDTILFSNQADDGNRLSMDVANSIVTESIVSGLLGGNIGGVIGNLAGPMRGPVVYATGSLNPPDITIWGVKRCFPRKKRLTSTSTIKVGTFSDLIPVGEPF